MLWLLEPDTLRRLQHAQQQFSDPTAMLRWEAEQSAAAESRDGLPQGLLVAGGVATVSVEGVLTKRPDFWAKFFGGSNTTYSSIRNALAFAASSADVGEIVFAIDSPGGSVDGLIELLDSIAHVRQHGGKPMRAVADNAQSAAYGIAAAVGKIEARGRGGTFGSIGTAVSIYVPTNVVTLTNTDSPDKRPDLTTEAGKAVVVKYLDQVNHEFVSAIAQGRGVALPSVTDGYGRGASMTAAEAKRLGLIDSIATTAPRAVPSSNKGKKAVASQDPESESRAAQDAAVARGVAQERDRVLGHITMGESSGDMAIALDAIRSGAGMTVELQARYMSAGMNRADRGKRQTESNTAEAQLTSVGAASPAATSADLGDQVVSVLQSQVGEKSFVRA
jgi:ClpP class serine protease